MTYIYECDGFCGPDDNPYHERPALTGEFNENWYDNNPHGDRLRQQGYERGDLITLCPDCTQRLLLNH